MEGGDEHAVVGDGHLLLLGQALPGGHLLGIEGAAAAVDHQGVGREILGELPAGGEGILKLLAGVALQPLGDFHGADVLALAVVGTALGDEHLLPFPERFQRCHPGHGEGEIPLVPRHEDGKGREGHRRRHQLIRLAEDLAVGDDDFRRRGQRGKGLGELRVPTDQGGRPGLEHIANHLLLGQDQPPLGGGLVDGHHQHRRIAGIQQIPHQGALLGCRLGKACRQLLEFMDVVAGLGADVDGILLGLRHGFQ